MSLKRLSYPLVLSLSLFGFVSLTGCGDAPANVEQPQEMSEEEAKAYEEQMRKTGGKG